MPGIRWIALGSAFIAAVVFGLCSWAAHARPTRFITQPVTRGDLVRAITTTGSVNPVATVQVGSSVSGPIQSIACDFNSEVEAGQLCAKIDPRAYQEALDQAEANLASAEAQLAKDRASLDYAKINYERDRGLRDTGVVSQDAVDSERSAYEQARSQLSLDEATIRQRRAELDGARVDLDYTDIVSPVNGTVVARNVDVGQTVAASFQTPTLFLIAQDLTKMQIDTNVSESDIGLAREGQKATFSVEAYPHQTFVGQVVQVRRAPITVQNVVTYDVVIGVENPERQLFPGMTANVRILVEQRNDVRIAPTRALRFDPDEDRAVEVSASNAPDDHHVWILRDGRPVQRSVSIGLDDGINVEITDGALELGEPVIVDVANAAAAPAGDARARSPFRF